MAAHRYIYWADLHNHNDVGYGVGTLARSFDMAEELLDIYAMTPHGHWPDPPDSDQRMREEHDAGFERVDRRFAEVAAAANARYRPGEFVSFFGFEWHSLAWGDYHVIFPGNSGDLFKAASLEELQSFARKTGALLIPHHVGYKLGWRGLNWDTRDPELSPVVEVYSEHGSSMEALSHLAMTAHSMGGSARSQTALARLAAGQRFGLTAGTDTHHGHPASYNEGLTAIMAENLTREAVFAALRARHTYAVSGDRIGLALSSGAAVMGDSLPCAAARALEIQVDPLAPLEFVKLYRNGRPVQTWVPAPPTADTPAAGEWVVRLDFGWDRLGSRDLTLWEMEFDLEDAELTAAIPCFSGGPAGRERMNRMARPTPRKLRIESFTSRDNPVPINGVVLRIRSAGDFRIGLRGRAETGWQAGEFAARTTLRELLSDDLWVQTLPRFSSPKLRIGQPWLADELRFATAWRDQAPASPAGYLLKAQQVNGQVAWSSPIWFEDTDKAVR